MLARKTIAFFFTDKGPLMELGIQLLSTHADATVDATIFSLKNLPPDVISYGYFFKIKMPKSGVRCQKSMPG